MRSLCRSIVATAIIGITLALTSAPASACSCAAPVDQEMFEYADVVFLGDFADYEYEEDADGDGVQASDDPAYWSFSVSEVFKGEAFETQRISSPVSGASCGLEIAKSGTFYVFANGSAEALTAGLCGGTRSAAGGPLDLDPVVDPVAPIVNAPPTTADPPTTAPTTTFAVDPGSPEDEVVDQFSGGTFFVIGFIAVGIIGAIVAARLAKRSRDRSDQEWRSQDD